VRLLLDTHVALWTIIGDRRLSATARSKISGNDSVHVSVASLWEIAIKHALRRDRPIGMPISAEQALELFEGSQFRMLPVLPEHALAVARLPPARTDPFDRLLVAQARVEQLQLLTADAAVAAYGDGVELI
jgi:PIN domain nuclease of toxin-antitoxin system